MTQPHQRLRTLLFPLSLGALLGLNACDPSFGPRDVEAQAVDREQIPDLGGSEGGLEGGSDGLEPTVDDAVCPIDCGGETCDGCGFVEPAFDVPECGVDEIDDDTGDVPPMPEPEPEPEPGAGSEGGLPVPEPDTPEGPWGTSGVGLEQDDELGFTSPLRPSADKKKGNCYPPLPAGANPLDGTKLISIRWMEQFRTATCSNPWVNAPLTFNDLTDAQVDQIIDNCKGKPTEIEKLLCVAKAVDVAVDGTADASGDKVCRHHMGSLYKVLKKMGYGNTATGSMTHGWNEVAIDTNGDGVVDTIVVLDSYNSIYYTVPK